MNFHLAAALILGLTLVGCVADDHLRPVSLSRTVEISGTIRLPDGSAVWRAKVTTSTNQTTFTDRAGVYRMTLPFSTEPVTIAARDGYTPGMVYAVTHYDSGKVTPDHNRVLDIVLRYSTPI